MTLASDYKRQLGWRDWPGVLDALPPLAGTTILDLGCGVGDLAAEFVARGARVIGVDMNDELLHEARSRGLVGAEFRCHDLRTPLELDAPVDGLWCSFTAAYFVDLPAALALWVNDLRAGGWIALTEIDDLFGHEPLSACTKSLFDGYAREALAAARYDFRMGRKLPDHLQRAGFAVSKALTVRDQELSFDGPAPPDVLEAWRNRLDRMTLLRGFCGDDFEPLRGEFLSCLVRPDHRSLAKVCFCSADRSRVTPSPVGGACGWPGTW